MNCSGETIAIYDPLTGQITNSELLEDELDFDIENYNRQVVTEPFNRAILKELTKDINPSSPEIQGETLILSSQIGLGYLIVAGIISDAKRYGL